MRVLGVLVAAVAAVAAVLCVRGIFSAPRPRDLGWALGAPVAIVLAIAGAVVAFAPGAL